MYKAFAEQKRYPRVYTKNGMGRLCLAICGICALSRAQDGRLEELRTSLASLRAQSQAAHRNTRGATPALTVIKRLLRDWTESRLAAFSQTGDEDALNRELQVALLNAGVLCPGNCDFTSLGYVDQVRVHHQGEFLTVQTSAGIACGYDDSAYLYEWRAGWRRIFATEQNTYTKTGYLPQTIYSVQISSPDAAGSRLVLTLGSRPGCSNAFQPLYYRLWRLAAGAAQPQLLLDASEIAFMGDYPPATAILSPNGVRIAFTAGGTGYGSGHQAERHFEIAANRVRQVEPIAPAPRDFVEEWLAASWKQSAALAESPALQTWHARLHRDDGRGDFPDPPLQCGIDPNLWQIGIRLHGVDGKTYYLVRWRQPDHFTLADISDHPLCN